MVYLFGIALSALVLVSAALVAMVYTWRRDLARLYAENATLAASLKEVSDQRTILEITAAQLKLDVIALRGRERHVTEALDQEVTRTYERDISTITSGNPDRIVDALKYKLRETIETGANDPPVEIGSTTDRMRPPVATRADTDRADLKR